MAQVARRQLVDRLPRDVAVLRSTPPGPFAKPIFADVFAEWTVTAVVSFIRSCGKAPRWTDLANAVEAAQAPVGAQLAAHANSTHELQTLFEKNCALRINVGQAMALRRHLNKHVRENPMPQGLLATAVDAPTLLSSRPATARPSAAPALLVKEDAGSFGGDSSSTLDARARVDALSVANSRLAACGDYLGHVLSAMPPELPVAPVGSTVDRSVSVSSTADHSSAADSSANPLLQDVGHATLVLNTLAQLATGFAAALRALLSKQNTDTGADGINAQALLLTLQDWVPTLLKYGVTPARFAILLDFLCALGAKDDQPTTPSDGAGSVDTQRSAADAAESSIEQARRAVRHYNSARYLWAGTPPVLGFLQCAAQLTTDVTRIARDLVSDLATTPRAGVDVALAARLLRDCFAPLPQAPTLADVSAQVTAELTKGVQSLFLAGHAATSPKVKLLVETTLQRHGMRSTGSATTPTSLRLGFAPSSSTIAANGAAAGATALHVKMSPNHGNGRRGHSIAASSSDTAIASALTKKPHYSAAMIHLNSFEGCE